MKLQLVIYSVIVCLSCVKAKSILNPNHKPQKQFKVDYKNPLIPKTHEYENHADEEEDDSVISNHDDDVFVENLKKPPLNIVSWVDRKAISRVKNQYDIGKCSGIGWAFVLTDVLEAQSFIQNKTDKLVDLSAQELVDCTYSMGNNDCNYEFELQNALDYILVNGISTSESYPFTGNVSKVCLRDPKKKAVKVTKIDPIPKSLVHINEMKKSLGLRVGGGPLIATVDASEPEFEKYQGGIYERKTCSEFIEAHHVLIVGYNATVDSEAYWIVKNSWGENWGENGYIRIKMNALEPDCILKEVAFLEVKF